MNTQNDGLRFPAIDQLVKKTNSKYKLVIACAKRAKELEFGKDEVPLISVHVNKKSIGIALEEILADKVIIKN